MNNEIIGLIIIAFITTAAGTCTRIVIEFQKQKVNNKRLLLIGLSSLVVGYVNFELMRRFSHIHFLGVTSVLLAMISVDLVLIFVRDAPNIFKERLKDLINKWFK